MITSYITSPFKRNFLFNVYNFCSKYISNNYSPSSCILFKENDTDLEMLDKLLAMIFEALHNPSSAVLNCLTFYNAKNYYRAIIYCLFPFFSFPKILLIPKFNLRF